MGMLSAGSRRTLFFAEMTSTPCSAQAQMTSATGRTVSTPSIRPSPVTLLTPGAPVSVSTMKSDFSCTDCSSGPSSRCRMLSAPAQQAGLPPKVEPWLPGVSTFCTFSPSSVAPSGSPPPSPLAVETMSGWTP